MTEQAPKLVALFVRHGQTEANKEKRFRGQMDIPLDNAGRQQALDIRGFLASHLGDQQLGASFRSSKDRARETADLILGPGKTKVVKNFDALNVGKFSGQKKTDENMKEIMHYQKYPEQKIPGGERINDFRARTNPEIMMAVKEGEKTGRPSMVVAHSSTIHQVSHLFHHDHNAVKVTPGGVVGVYKRPAGGYYAQALLNESSNTHEPLMS
jgi:broad specificity phosphatase PhoE